MHEYLRSGIKFAVGKGILVNNWVKHLSTINAKLSKLPKLKYWRNDAKQHLNTEDVKQIITCACPVSWQTKLQLSVQLNYKHTVEPLTTFLHAVQRNMADAARSKELQWGPNDSIRTTIIMNARIRMGARPKTTKRPKIIKQGTILK